MTIELRRTAERWKGGPLTWWPVTRADGRRNAMVACGRGHIASLADHTIGPDGTVTPSLVCPETGCDWHEWVRLDGWDGTGPKE